MVDIGREEGCPAEQPATLDEIIARPVTTKQSAKSPPVAKPIPNQGAQEQSAAAGTAPCDPEEQRRFGECVQPLTAFQPHPLAVIKQPKQINEACQTFKNFLTCK